MLTCWCQVNVYSVSLKNLKIINVARRASIVWAQWGSLNRNVQIYAVDVETFPRISENFDLLVRPWMPEQNVSAIHPNIIDIFQSGPQRRINQQTDISIVTTMAKNSQSNFWLLVIVDTGVCLQFYLEEFLFRLASQVQTQVWSWSEAA